MSSDHTSEQVAKGVEIMPGLENSWDLKWELLIADTWNDVELKQRLLSEPAAVFKERGIHVPEGVSINVVANTDDTVNLVLPGPPGEEELSDEELEDVAGGGVRRCRGGTCSNFCNSGGGGGGRGGGFGGGGGGGYRCRPARCRRRCAP